MSSRPTKLIVPSTHTKQRVSYRPQREVFFGLFAGLMLTVGIFGFDRSHLFTVKYELTNPERALNATTSLSGAEVIPPSSPQPVLDTEAYDRKLLALANNGLLALLDATSTLVTVASTTSSTTALVRRPSIPPTASEVVASTTKVWPVKTVYPNPNPLLPFNRIIAFYGNFYSTGMGVLGEYPAAEMKQRLHVEIQAWEAADPTTPVIPAIDYIAMTAQGSPGVDTTYRFRMPDDQIDHAIELAKAVNGIVILEVQAGTANLEAEIESLEKYLRLPVVHLAIDPEFRMITGARPGTVIGTVDANDVNKAAAYLATLVTQYNLPPKILIVHRFTHDMVTHAKKITPLPEVQVVMDMDGWGEPAKKFGTYNNVVASEPVQFTGFKLFYKNDIKPPSTHMLTPAEVLTLSPQPSFIQYQ